MDEQQNSPPPAPYSTSDRNSTSYFSAAAGQDNAAHRAHAAIIPTHRDTIIWVFLFFID